MSSKLAMALDFFVLIVFWVFVEDGWLVISLMVLFRWAMFFIVIFLRRYSNEVVVRHYYLDAEGKFVMIFISFCALLVFVKNWW